VSTDPAHQISSRFLIEISGKFQEIFTDIYPALNIYSAYSGRAFVS